MRVKIESIRCDFCGYGGPYTRPEDFRAIEDVDLCYWCADDRASEWIESGRHRVAFAAGSWTCSCGATMPTTMLAAPWVVRVVPNLARATANIHVGEP